MRQRALHLILALALVLFSWTELTHASDLQAHLDEQGCEFCLLGAHLGHGVPASAPPLPMAELQDTAPRHPATAEAPQSFRHSPAPRGPPTLS